jgi:hypothetical protein
MPPPDAEPPADAPPLAPAAGLSPRAPPGLCALATPPAINTAMAAADINNFVFMIPYSLLLVRMGNGLHANVSDDKDKAPSHTAAHIEMV